MFVDFLTLLLINMVAGLVLLAGFIYAGVGDTRTQRWAPGFLMVGAIAFIFGGDMTLRWPLPGPFNIAYGEMSVLFGIVFLGLGWTLARGWSLFTVAVYAAFAGLAAIIVGARLIHLGLSQQPLLAGIGFILTGLVGVLAAPVLTIFARNRPVHIVGVLLTLAAAAIWALTGYTAYWMHLSAFAHYLPR